MKNTGNKTLEMEYLSELIHSQMENRIPKPMPEGLTIEAVEKIAAEGHMDYCLLAPLMKFSLPPETVERLRTKILYSTMKTLQQVCAARELQAALEAAGIRNQLLKGAVMKQMYPRPELREMSDIDIMLYEDSFDKAEQILFGMGYQKEQAVKHHVIFKKNPYLVVEMHWSLYEETVDKEQYLYYKNQFRAQLKPGCEYSYEFSAEDFYVYLISHMAKHFYENGCGIRNLMDIYIYQQKYGAVMDPKTVHRELKKCGLTDFEYHAKRLADIWLGGESSTEFYNQMFAYMLECGIYGKSENGIWGQLVKQERARSGFYFPSLNYMKEYYPWLNKFPALLPAAWFVRGIHGIASKKSRDRAKLLEHGPKYEITKKIYQELNLNFTK